MTKSEPTEGIVAALRVVVDEAGNPDCAANPSSKSKGGFVVGAVAIPEMEVDALLRLLPRDASGRPLKSSSRELGASQLLAFLNALPIDRISVSIVAIATNSETNESISAKAEEVANYWRDELHKQRIARSSLLRLRCGTEAILNAWAFHSTRQMMAAKERRVAEQRTITPRQDWAVRPGDLDEQVSFMSVVIDEGNQTRSTRRDAPGWFQEAMRRRNVIVRPFRWASEADEPLLAIPDLLTGMILRHAERRDLPKAMEWLDAAWKSGRVRMQDGMTTRIPDLPHRSSSVDLRRSSPTEPGERTEP